MARPTCEYDMTSKRLIENPYRPGAGHMPPFLAGRLNEQKLFLRLLRQPVSTENILVTGLRGVGKTVLMRSLKSLAESEGWIWVGNDLSETASLSEERLAVRILTDVSQSLSQVFDTSPRSGKAPDTEQIHQNSPFAFEALRAMYERAPGLVSDRLKSVLIRLGTIVNRAQAKGIVFAYDEAQCLHDHAERNEFPMSLLIETIASLQKTDGVAPCILALSGLPQVFDALTKTRTYTERMFHVVHLERLSRDDTFAAIAKPFEQLSPPLNASKQLIDKAVDLTGGYPYLIQFFGKELVDQLMANGGVLHPTTFPSEEALDRLDAGLFSARWNKTTDKQREILRLLANRGPGCDFDFSAQEIADLSRATASEITNVQATQLLGALNERGLVYRTRHGYYAFTVPMSEAMIRRRLRSSHDVDESWRAARAPDETNGRSPVEGRAAPPEPGQRKKAWRWFG